MYGNFQQVLQDELQAIQEAGLYKNERLIQGAQQAAIQVAGKEVLNFCGNNYLGLSNHPRLVQAAKDKKSERKEIIDAFVPYGIIAIVVCLVLIIGGMF